MRGIVTGTEETSGHRDELHEGGRMFITLLYLGNDNLKMFDFIFYYS